jgi:hypothetical protein
MSPKDFEKAVKSLRGYKGMVGVMGGEPTMHPEFEKIAEILNRHVTEHRAISKEKIRERYTPKKNFGDYRNKHLHRVDVKKGLWSSLGKGYYKHYETIQETFRYQCINDHTNSGEHIALLLPRKELGIPDKDWVEYRDNCWLQREWSSCITPKGAFFCEVAGALDTLLGGPGGWPIEPGWWRRQPRDFGSQLEWCELCSACLPVPSVRANSGVDLLTRGSLKILKGAGSPKVKNSDNYIIVNTKKLKIKKGKENSSCEPYLGGEGQAGRVGDTNYSIMPSKIDVVMVCVNYDDYLNITLPYNVSQADSVTVVTDLYDKRTPKVCKKHGANVVYSKALNPRGRDFYKGRGLNDGFASLDNPDWVLVMDADVILQPGLIDRLKHRVLNPGVLYYTRRWGPASVYALPALLQDLKRGLSWRALFKRYANKKVAREEGRDGNDLEYLPFGYFQLFNPRAKVLSGRGADYYPTRSRTAELDDKAFGFEVFKGERHQPFPVPDFDVLHLPHGNYRENWGGRRSPRIEVLGKMLRKSSAFRGETYVCERECFFNGKNWEVGEEYRGSRTDVPIHFRRKL